MKQLSHKNFSSETMKKIKWATKMYREWWMYRNDGNDCEKIDCNLDEKSTITRESLNFAIPHFISEVKKVNGEPLP